MDEDYVDIRTAARSGNLLTVWLWTALPRPQSIEGVGTFTHALAQVRYDCERRTRTMLHLNYYRGDVSVERIPIPAPESSPWVPGTVGEAVGEAVCG